TDGHVSVIAGLVAGARYLLRAERPNLAEAGHARSLGHDGVPGEGDPDLVFGGHDGRLVAAAKGRGRGAVRSSGTGRTRAGGEGRDLDEGRAAVCGDGHGYGDVRGEPGE